MTKNKNTNEKKSSLHMGLPFGKPTSTKRKEVKYPPLFTNTDCYFCGSRQGLEMHHCIGGIANRKLSEKYGLYTPLCQKCHYNVTNNINKELYLKLKTDARKRFIDAYGEQMFVETFGRLGFKGEI